MTHLVPCPGCQRHVRVSETLCPFCSAALSLANTPAPLLPTTRLGRAATFAFGATLLGATALTACGGESEEHGDSGKGGASGSASGGTSAGGNAGTNAGGNAGTGAGGTTGSGGTQNTGGGAGIAQPYGVPPDGGLQPPYGFPPPPDAGMDDGGGAQPLYGLPPPPDGGFDDDGGGAQPEYGAAPAD